MKSFENNQDALTQGRRVYVGNLHYVLKPLDIEEMLVANDFGDFENIHVSIDPVSGRNPGYCFVDFADKATADRALTSLIATIRGRQLKIGPCDPKKKRNHEDKFVFQRWGDWSPKPGSAEDANGNANSNGRAANHSTRGQQGPRGAIAHYDDMMENFKGRRVYVGGLPRMIDQEQNSQEIRAIFADFNPEAIGKRITPHEKTRSLPGNHHYCFVDFATVEEAEAAISALDGKQHAGGALRVSLAKQLPGHLENRRSEINPGRNDDNNEKGSWGSRNPRSENTRPQNSEGLARAMASGNWRSKPPAAAE